jgi:integrase
MPEARATRFAANQINTNPNAAALAESEAATRSAVAKPDINGNPTYPQLRHYWDAARGQMGLTDPELFVFHACRHTFATRAIQAGVNIRVLQMLMGHKTIQTTIRYSHVDDRTLSDAIAQMAGHRPPPPSPSGGNATC